MAAFGLFWALSCHSRAETLEQSLRAQLDNIDKSEAAFFYRVPMLSQQMHYMVPPEVASILEAHAEAELTPVLAALKASANDADASLVQNWIAIAESHLRGAPNVVDVTAGAAVKHIPVVCYSLPLFHRRR